MPRLTATAEALEKAGNFLMTRGPAKPRKGARKGPRGTDGTFQDYRALRTLSDRWQQAYKLQLDAMVAAIREYVEEHIVRGPLAKAGPRKPVVTPAQLQDIQRIIERYHLAFVEGTVGPGTLTVTEVQQLIAAGVLPKDVEYTFDPATGRVPPKAMAAIEDAYRYGHVLASARNLTEKRILHGMTYEQFVQKWAPTIPLSDDERLSMSWAKHSAGTAIRGLGNRVAADFSTAAIEADGQLRRKYVGVVREAVAESIERRDTWRKLASDLGHKTQDWARDFQRIAATEKTRAMQEGMVEGLTKRYGDPAEVRVAKQPNPTACEACLSLHLTAGPGSPPKIFKLNELIENGSNVGKKRAAWKVGVGGLHPFCGCELIHVPEGMTFDEEGMLVPEIMTRSDWLEWDLRKALPKDPPKAPTLTYGPTVPDKGISVRVGDPKVRAEVERVIAATPKWLFDKNVGVTLVTTDIPRVQNPFEVPDFAYWTGNEIRLMQTLSPKLVDRVLKHELGHALNVHLVKQLGSVKAVRDWHKRLWRVSKEEGFVSDYAERAPIENAAEVSALYLYQKPRLMLRWPRQFAFAHKAYRDVARNGGTA